MMAKEKHGGARRGSRKSLRRGRRLSAEIVYGRWPRADLMPASEVRQRELRWSLTALTRWVVASLLFVIAITGAAFFLVVNSSQNLTAATQTVNDRQIALAGFGQLRDLKSAVSTLTEFTSVAMKNDTDWAKLWSELKTRIPSGTSVGTLTMLPASAGTGSSATSLGATISFVGNTNTLLDAASVLTNISTIPGYISSSFSYINSGSSGGKNYQYQLVVTVDQTYFTQTYSSGGANS